MSQPTLPFLERVPREPIAGPAPLLVLIHGRAAEAKTIFSIEGLLDKRLHVVAIQAPYQSQLGGYEWFWDPGVESVEIQDADRFEEPEKLLTENIRQHIERTKADAGNLFLWGFSQGAAMSLIVGLRGVLQPKGVVPMSGFLPTPVTRWEAWDKHSRYLLAHGTNDEVLPPETSKRAQEFLVSKGISAEYYEFKGRHKMTMECIAYVNNWLTSLAGLP
jgi:phospholipase/carboxylesterase